jgi:chemotaxis protein CheD
MYEDGKIINVGMSGMKVSTNPHSLSSSGIGSCVVITLYDPQKRVGAMAHPMLALPEAGRSDENEILKASLRYVEPAIDAMIKELTKLGAVKSSLESKLIGGANMFKVFDKNPDSIGIHNAEAAKNKLEKEGIKIVVNDTGGNVGRSVVFDLVTGLVEVKTKI